MPTHLVRCAAALAVVLPLLVGCGPERDQFPPACPSTVIPGLTADVSFYRPGSSGRDLTDLMLTGRITGLAGKCKAGGTKGTLDTDAVVRIELSRGPAMQGNQAAVLVFLAVVDGDRILDKRVFTLGGMFPSNVDRITVDSIDWGMTLPISATKSGAAYTLVAGFQLTPEQAEAARARGVQ